MVGDRCYWDLDRLGKSSKSLEKFSKNVLHQSGKL